MRGNKSLASKLLAKSVHPDSCPVRKKKKKTLLISMLSVHCSKMHQRFSIKLLL